MKITNKKKCGITFLILVVTIVFALILATAVTISFENIIDSTNKKEFANEINALQKLVEQYHFMNNKYPVTENEIEISLNGMTLGEKQQFINEPGYENGRIIVKEINLVEADVDNITRGIKADGDTLDVYTVSENTGTVYYLKGVEIEGINHYSLTTELKKSLDI